MPQHVVSQWHVWHDLLGCSACKPLQCVQASSATTPGPSTWLLYPGIQVDVDSFQSKLATKNEELADASSRFERLQGAKEKVEAELLHVVKQRREAQLSWTEKRTELEGRLQVLSAIYLPRPTEI